MGWITHISGVVTGLVRLGQVAQLIGTPGFVEARTADGLALLPLRAAASADVDAVLTQNFINNVAIIDTGGGFLFDSNGQLITLE